MKNNQRFFENLNKSLIFLFVLLLPTQLGKHFFFPFSYLSGVRSDYLASTIYLTDIIVFLLLIFNLKTVINFFRNPKILLIISLLFLNIIFSLSPLISLFRNIKIIEWLVVFCVVQKYVSQIINPLLIGATFELVLSIWQLFLKHSIQGIFYWFGERYFTLSTPDIAKASLKGIEFIRAYGTFSHPNSLAGFYLLIYFFALISANPAKPWRSGALLKYSLLFISSLLIFLSFSKIAIITFLILNIVYLLLQKNTYSSLQGQTLQICKPCMISRILVLVVLSSIFLSTQGDVLSLDKRLTLINNALTIFIHHPIGGVGLGAYLVAQNKIPIHYGYYFQQPVHNIFLLFLTETGIIITGIIAWLIIKYFRHVRAYCNTPLPLIFILLAIGITGSFDHYWLTLQQNFLLLAVVFSVSQHYKADQQSEYLPAPED